MTDNVKRAHDIALTVVSGMMSPAFLAGSAAASGETEIHFDIYAKYKETFDAALQALNRDFPEGMD